MVLRTRLYYRHVIVLSYPLTLLLTLCLPPNIGWYRHVSSFNTEKSIRVFILELLLNEFGFTAHLIDKLLIKFYNWYSTKSRKVKVIIVKIVSRAKKASSLLLKKS